VLDKGVVIAGAIRVNLLDIELLTIKVRPLIASVDRARESSNACDAPQPGATPQRGAAGLSMPAGPSFTGSAGPRRVDATRPGVACPRCHWGVDSPRGEPSWNAHRGNAAGFR
jgi:Gas vesicle protein